MRKMRNGLKIVIALFVGLAFLGLALPGGAEADFNKTKIAVLDFSQQGEGFETEDMGQIVAEWFITALVKEGRFDVVERAMLQKILNEQQMSLIGILDENSATQLGKILGVKVIISGSVMKLQGVLEVNARIIDVETASIIAAENVRSTDSTDLQSMIVQMSEKIIKNFPLEGYVVSHDDNTVSIDLGQRAGVRTGMEFMVFREGMVIKHPKTGEVLDVEKIETGKLRISSVNNKIAKAEIVFENEPGAIVVGNLVKSISGPLTPEEVPFGGGEAGSDRNREASDGTSSPPPRGIGQLAGSSGERGNALIAKIKSKNYRDKTYAAKRIIKEKIVDPAVLDVVEEELLANYTTKIRDRHLIDAMSWLVKALGAPKLPKYKPTIELVAKSAYDRKLKGYAQKALVAY
ncbi:MAG: hypothetical protein KJ950_00630 [Proteobacteria bacterium]|nr:hypothetical protein [Pseudomonadota bacterium]MBU1685858.1 hypothetical protein [Pseudomonadota bacterium]